MARQMYSWQLNRLQAKVFTKVIDTKTRSDFAKFVAEVIKKNFSEAEIVTIMCDNLSTHDAGSFYEAFLPEEAHALMPKVCFVPP